MLIVYSSQLVTIPVNFCNNSGKMLSANTPAVVESKVAGLSLPALPEDKKRKIICFSDKSSTTGIASL